MFVHQKGTVGTHPAHEQGFAESQQVHFGEIFFIDDRLDDLAVSGLLVVLFGRGGNADDFRGARRQFFDDRLAGAAQQDWLQCVAQLIQIPVAQQPAPFIHDPVPIEKPKCRPETAIVDEFNNRIEFIQSILKGRAGKYQGKRGFEGFDDAAGLGGPILDALAFVQDYQVPGHTLNGHYISQYLLVIADGEKRVALVLGRPLLGTTEHQSATAVAEALDLRLPLGFQRSRADDQHLGNGHMPG